MTNIDLLGLEMATLWEPDAYGRHGPEPLVALAVANDGQVLRFGAEVKGKAGWAPIGEALSADPGAPEVLEGYRRLLCPTGTIHDGPSYVLTGPLEAPSTALAILTSEEEAPPTLAAARPEAWWEPREWDDLLEGRLGPWAVGMLGNRVAALCHTPVGSRIAAEAGVWTHPEERGRGYAGAVTAAWAEVARTRFGTLFYSTATDNAASQAVARKLRLRHIGWIWQLRKGTVSPS